ncbi:hypothetical protein K523DRAFT_327974 [Schizophyllum commune Tattone D]|nr:hypothetical protein K523DRAFT_327974 [Schizophyllum commune Tattone D]
MRKVKRPINVHDLHSFGCPAYPLIPKKKRMKATCLPSSGRILASTSACRLATLLHQTQTVIARTAITGVMHQPHCPQLAGLLCHAGLCNPTEQKANQHKDQGYIEACTQQENQQKASVPSLSIGICQNSANASFSSVLGNPDF